MEIAISPSGGDASMNCPFPVFRLWNIAVWIPNAAQAPPAYHPIQFPCFNGGLLIARVRYFDIDRARSGLPEDVAALVEKLEADRTVVQLFNLNTLKTRRLIVQAGAFGEHEFITVTFREESKDKNEQKTFSNKTVTVNKKFFAVELPPATSINLEIGMKRFVNQPTYAFPWQSDMK